MDDTSGPRVTRIITVANQKGGVGKTTNSINLAAALGERGFHSLLIDLDATCGATKALKAPETGWVSTYEFITGEEEPSECIIDEEEKEIPLPRNVHLIPSSRKLNELDAWLVHPDNRWANALDLLQEPIDKVRGRYDFVILDTPPQITKTSLPAFKVADYVLLTAAPEKLAVDGLADALTDINNAQRAGNSSLKLLGVLFCSFTKGRGQSKLSKKLIDYVEANLRREDGGSYKLETEILRSVKLQEAQQMGQSIFEYMPNAAAADQYRALAAEVIQQIAAYEGEQDYILMPPASLADGVPSDPVVGDQAGTPEAEVIHPEQGEGAVGNA